MRAEYTLENTIAMADTSGRPFDPNADINGNIGGTVTVSSVGVNTATREVALTLSGSVAAGDNLVFVLTNIKNPIPSSDPGQAYMISAKAPAASANSLLLAAFVKKAGQGGVTVNLKDKADSQMILSQASVNIGGPGLPPEGIKKSGATGTFSFTGLQLNTGYHVWVSEPPAGYHSPMMDMPVWPGNPDKAYDFFMNNLSGADMKTLTVTVNNLPADLSKKAVVFAGGPAYYSENDTPSSSSNGGATRVYTLKVRAPGDYMVGVRPYMPPQATGMTLPPPPPEFMPLPPQHHYITDSRGITIDLPQSAQLASVTVELKDSGSNVPANGGVYAYAPVNPEVSGVGGLVNTGTGQIDLRLKKGITYIVGGGAPGMPMALEKKVLVDPSGNVFVEGAQAMDRTVRLTVSKPEKKITGVIKYSDGAVIPNVPVFAHRQDKRGDSPPSFTDSSGIYTLYVSPGTWAVKAFIPEVGLREVTGGADTSSSDVVTANLTLPAMTAFASATGLVTEGGSSLAGAHVWAESSSGEFLNGTITGQDGRYTLRIDSAKKSGAKIRAAAHGLGELAPQTYQDANDDNVGDQQYNFSFSLETVTVDFGRQVNGFARIFESGANGFHFGKELKNVSSVTLKAPAGTYGFEAFIEGIGRVSKSGVTAPGSLDLTADVALNNTVTLTVTVAGGGDSAWVNVVGMQQGKSMAKGKNTSGGTAVFEVPKNAEISVNARMDGYFPARRDVQVGAANASADFTLTPLASGTTVTVNLTGTGTTTGNTEYFVWAKNKSVATGNVVRAKSSSPTGISMTLPAAGSWVFKASTDGYESDEATVTVAGNDTVSIAVSNTTIKKTATAMVKPTQGGTVSNMDVGVKLVIPANALGNNSNNASVNTNTTSAVSETSTAKPMGEAKEIKITDQQGNPITSLSQPIEIVLSYHGEYLTWPADQRDAMAQNMQLSYWDESVGDWVTIPATNDTTIHEMRGYTDHLTKFAVVYPQSLVLRSMETSQPAQSSGGSGGGGQSSVSSGVSEAALSSALESSKSTGRVTLQATSSDGSLTLKMDQFNQIEASTKPMEIKSSSVTFSLGAAVLKAADLDMGGVASFTLGASKAGESTAGELSSRAKNRDRYSVRGDVFQFTASAINLENREQAIKKFNGKVTVYLPVPAPVKDAASKGRLVAGRFNDSTGSWDAVSGSYDAASGTYRFETDGFSYWALLEKVDLPLKTFSDVKGHWAQKDIEYMATNGFVSGMGSGLYAPDAGVTRAQFAAMLVNALRLEGRVEVPFRDVVPGQWYYFPVGRAYAAGLVKGVEPDRFGPEELVTREQVAAMIANALEYKGRMSGVDDVEEALKAFTDQPSISGWARKPAARAVKHGILRGRPVGGAFCFAPADRATRAEAAVMLKNFLGQIN